MALAIASLVAGCGGGGGGDNAAPGIATATSTAAASPASGAASSPSSTASAATGTTPVASGIVVTATGGIPVLTLSTTRRSVDVPYSSGHRSLVSDVLAMTHSQSTHELVVSGYLLAGGAPGVQGLDPDTFAVHWSIPTSTAADVIEVSGDGSKVFAGLCDEHAIAQLDVATRTVEHRFQVNEFGTLCAGDIKVRPGTSTTIAASMVVWGPLVPSGFGVTMFRDGARLPDAALTVNDATLQGAAKLRFLDASTLVGYSYFTSQAQLQWYAVGASGVKVVRVADAAAAYSGWGEEFDATDGKLFFNGGFVLPQDQSRQPQVMRGCMGAASGYIVPSPDPSTVLCVTSVPQTQRKHLQDVELQLEQWSLLGERLVNRVRMNLADVITIPGLATPEVQIIKVIALPGGQVILHLWAFQSNRILLIGAKSSDLVPVAVPAVQRSHFDLSGVSLDRLDLPATALAHDAVSNITYATITPAYGPNGASIAKIDAATKQVKGFLLLDHEPQRLNLSADGRYAYVASDFQIDQIDLANWTRGWTWQSSDGAIMSMDVRPGTNDQLAVVTTGLVQWLAAGQVRATLPRRRGSDSLSTGFVFFRSPTDLVEFVPSLSGGAAIYSLDANRNTLTAAVNAVQTGAAQAATSYSGAFGLAYSRLGEVIDLSTLALSTTFQTLQSLQAGPPVGLAVWFPDSSMASGVAQINAITALARDRTLSASMFGGAALFDLRDGMTSTRRFVLADPSYLVSVPGYPLTAINRDTAAFGQTTPGYAGQGALYFLQISN